MNRHFFLKEDIQMVINISRKIQIKTTVRYHSTLTRMAVRKKFGEQQVLGRMQRNWKPHLILVGKYTGIAILAVWQFLIQLKIESPYEPAIQQGIWLNENEKCLREMKIYLNKNLYMNVSIINNDSEKVEYGNIHTMEYYSTIQRNEIGIDTCYTTDKT